MEHIVENTTFSTATVSKYLNNLENKGIFKNDNEFYLLEDLMIKTWLEHEKENRGVYPD